MQHTLLLADDSVTIQRVIELTFADEDIRVVAVGDGLQAIARIEADRPDVVLADVGMPEKDGYEVAAYIKSQPHLKDIPVVLLTGAFEPVDEARARALGCEGVLVKPFEPQMVVNRVRELLGGRRSPSLWATSPADFSRPEGLPGPLAAETPQVQPAGAVTPPAATTGEAAPTESLDDYFDRLDAAFGTLETEGPAASPADAGPLLREPVLDVEDLPRTTAAEPLASASHGWDPSLSEDEPPTALLAAPDRTTEAPAPAGPPSLSDAFAALLAAEQGQPLVLPRSVAVTPPPEPATPRPPARGLSDEDIDTIVQRVIQRLTSGTVRDTVVEVAERLVREEIARIKSAAP